MGDGNSTSDDTVMEWPLEGYFECGGQGLFVTPDCLGREFASRTANYPFTISLPRLGANARMRPPNWTYDPADEVEAHDVDMDPGDDEDTLREMYFWGYVGPNMTAVLVQAMYQMMGRPPDDFKGDSDARVVRCRFYTELAASNKEEFQAAAQSFAVELQDWWKRFTSWVSILTSQDFAQVGAAIGLLHEWGVTAWTSGPDGQRVPTEPLGLWRADFKKKTPLELDSLQACVTVAGNQEPPPAEWLLIRDARSFLSQGENRRAVIDAATGAELAMTTLIDRFLDDANALEPLRKALARSSTNLGGKKAVLNLLRPGLVPQRVQDDLINKRNGASHHGKEYSEQEAQAAVDIATVIVESAYPLDSLLPNRPDNLTT